MGALRRLRRIGRPTRGRIAEGRPDILNRGTFVVGRDVAIGSRPVDTEILVGSGGRLAIGDRVRIGHGSSLHAHLSVEIGDDVLIGAFVVVMDTDHHANGDRAGTAPTAPIVVEAGARIGAYATLLRGAHVGAGARVEPGSVVAGFVAPGVRVAGNPARPPSGRGPAGCHAVTVDEACI